MKKRIYKISELGKSLNLIMTGLKSVMLGGVMVGIMLVGGATAEAANVRMELNPQTTEISSQAQMPVDFIQQISIDAENVAKQKSLTLMNQWVSEMETFADYGANWDGEGADPISLQTIENGKLILDETISSIRKIESIYPTPFGSICIEWKVAGGYINAEFNDSKIAFYDDRREIGIFESWDSTPFNNDSINTLVTRLQFVC